VARRRYVSMGRRRFVPVGGCRVEEVGERSGGDGGKAADVAGEGRTRAAAGACQVCRTSSTSHASPISPIKEHYSTSSHTTFFATHCCAVNCCATHCCATNYLATNCCATIHLTPHCCATHCLATNYLAANCFATLRGMQSRGLRTWRSLALITAMEVQAFRVAGALCSSAYE